MLWHEVEHNSNLTFSIICEFEIVIVVFKKFDPNVMQSQHQQQKQRHRGQKVTWFNPTYSVVVGLIPTMDFVKYKATTSTNI